MLDNAFLEDSPLLSVPPRNLQHNYSDVLTPGSDPLQSRYPETEVSGAPIDALLAHIPVDTRTAPLQIWEGKVVQLSEDGSAMEVLLFDKTGQLPDHTAQMSLEWVAEQDRPLVKPGAIFYLSLYKETKRGTIKNSQELRFRRLPNWSQSQIKRIMLEAEQLLAWFSVKEQE